MDDSFRVRVDKVFGSLTEASNLSSLWCLTDDEIEKREWNRDTPSRDLLDFDSKPCPPNIDGFFSKPKQTLDFPKQLQSDLEHLTDGQEPDDDNESEIRSGIGLDCTLDYEEEEDEFDKVAVDREKEKQQPSDRLYTREVSDYGISVDTYHELPLTLQDIKRDPRANHEAAKLRLKEDAEAALREGHLGSMPPAASKIQGQDDAHSPKRLKEDNNLLPNSSIPDYIRNPSKYTCYTLDVSDDMDEESNRKAYMDFLSLMKKQSQLDDDNSIDFQKSPTFNMKMKHPAGTFTKQGVEAEQMQGKNKNRPEEEEEESGEEMEVSSPENAVTQSESESESESEPEQEQPPKKPPVAAPKKPQPQDSSSSTEEESESESEPETQKPSPVVKPIASKPMDEPKKAAPTTEKKSRSKADATTKLTSPKKSTAVVGAKRPVDDGEAKESKRSKKKPEKEIETPVKKTPTDDVKRQLFQRLWSEDDEIAILKGMIDYRSKKKADPVADLGAFHEFIKKSLHIDVSKSQLQDKIRRLKKKYENNAGKEKKGKERTFSKPHEQKAYELSQKIWGKEKSDKVQDEVVKVDNVTASKGQSNNVGKDNGVLDVVKKEKLSAELVNTVEVTPNLSLISCGGSVTALEKWLEEYSGLLSMEKRNEIMEKSTSLKVTEADLCLRRVNLISEQGELMREALKASGIEI